MTEESRVLLKAIGWLLDYPDEHFGERLETVEKALSDLPLSAARERLLESIPRLAATDPIVLREEYTRLFDFNPGTSLELTYHKWGDAKERGAALARLQRAYDAAGWTPTGGELPDFLPRMLEFLSLAPGDGGRQVLDDYRPEVSGLADRVAATSTNYGPILEALSRVALD